MRTHMRSLSCAPSPPSPSLGWHKFTKTHAYCISLRIRAPPLDKSRLASNQQLALQFKACSAMLMAPPQRPMTPQRRRAPSSWWWDNCRPCGMTGTCGTMCGMLYGCLLLLASKRRHEEPDPIGNARRAPPWASASVGHAAHTCGSPSARIRRGAREGTAAPRAPARAAAAAAAAAAPAGCPMRALTARWRSARARVASWRP